MNNNYFYKLASIADRIDWMRKVAQTTYPTTQAPATVPATTAPTPSTLNTTASTTSTPGEATGEPVLGPGIPSYPPDSMTGRFVAGKPMGVPELKPGQKGYIPQNANDLANHWIAQKQNYYRGRADKYPQYKDYTVSAEAQKGLMREAKNIWKKYNGNIEQIKPYLKREGAFNYATNEGWKRLQGNKQEGAEVPVIPDAVPTQNPTATSAIQNPQPTWTSEDDRFNQAMAASNNIFWHHYDPRIQTPGFNRYNAYHAAAVAPFYSSSYTASKVNQAFNDELMANGLHFSNDPDVNTLWKAYQDAWSAHDYSDQFPATAPKDAALDKQNLAFWNAINLPTGDVRSPAQLVDHLRESDPKLQTMPGGWDPNVWQALVNLYSRMKKV